MAGFFVSGGGDRDDDEGGRMINEPFDLEREVRDEVFPFFQQGLHAAMRLGVPAMVLIVPVSSDEEYTTSLGANFPADHPGRIPMLFRLIESVISEPESPMTVEGLLRFALFLASKSLVLGTGVLAGFAQVLVDACENTRTGGGGNLNVTVQTDELKKLISDVDSGLLPSEGGLKALSDAMRVHMEGGGVAFDKSDGGDGKSISLEELVKEIESALNGVEQTLGMKADDEADEVEDEDDDPDDNCTDESEYDEYADDDDDWELED